MPPKSGPLGRDRVVVPLHDLSVLEEEHAHSPPRPQRPAREVVDSLVEDHRTLGKGLEYFESGHAIEEALDPLFDGATTFDWLCRLRHAIGNGVGEEFCDLGGVAIPARPGRTEVVHDLDV